MDFCLWRKESPTGTTQGQETGIVSSTRDRFHLNIHVNYLSPRLVTQVTAGHVVTTTGLKMNAINPRYPIRGSPLPSTRPANGLHSAPTPCLRLSQQSVCTTSDLALLVLLLVLPSPPPPPPPPEGPPPPPPVGPPVVATAAAATASPSASIHICRLTRT